MRLHLQGFALNGYLPLSPAPAALVFFPFLAETSAVYANRCVCWANPTLTLLGVHPSREFPSQPAATCFQVAPVLLFRQLDGFVPIESWLAIFALFFGFRPLTAPAAAPLRLLGPGSHRVRLRRFFDCFPKLVQDRKSVV